MGCRCGFFLAASAGAGENAQQRGTEDEAARMHSAQARGRRMIRTRLSGMRTPTVPIKGPCDRTTVAASHDEETNGYGVWGFLCGFPRVPYRGELSG